MRRRKQSARWQGCVLLAMVSLAWAQQTTELSDDFLEYLGSLEGDDDNWTNFVTDTAAQPAAAASSSASSATTVAKHVVPTAQQSSSAAKVER